MNYYNGHLSDITDIFKTFVGQYQKSPQRFYLRPIVKIMEHLLSQGLPEADFYDHHDTMTVTMYKDKLN